ncbi:MAG: hypothetical protein QGD91_12275 [Actinomycetota bacterium]|nr:hypothetical protein [Actinomycetota bacterium]
MSLRDKILNADDITVEPVDIPEWDVTVAVKGLTVGEQRRFLKTVRKRTGTPQDTPEIDTDKMQIQLFIACVYDPDDMKTPMFEQADAQALQAKSARAMLRVFKVAAKLSGLGDDDDEVMDELKAMASDESS